MKTINCVVIFGTAMLGTINGRHFSFETVDGTEAQHLDTTKYDAAGNSDATFDSMFSKMQFNAIIPPNSGSYEYKGGFQYLCNGAAVNGDAKISNCDTVTYKATQQLSHQWPPKTRRLQSKLRQKYRN